MQWLIYGMVYLGSLLMVRNIYGFVQFARYIKERKNWGKEIRILYIPIFLLVMFLLGYLGIGIFGKPDLLVACILFGGSVFVFIMYYLLSRITRRIIKAERLQAELYAAEESAKAKSSFLASISHEMRTPMNVILGLKTLALSHPDLPADIRDQLERIGQSGKHLLELINNTLDIQQIEAGELVVKREEFSLRDVIDQVSAIAATVCEKKGLTYSVTVKEEAAGWYWGDAMLLKQALLNVMDNAVKYTDAPGRVDFLVDRASEDGKKRVLRFSVRDDGIGMSPEFLPKAFDLFSREDPSFTTRYGGSGMGLTVARQKIQLLGGEIKAESQKNVGSLFTVTVPFQVSDKKEEETEEDGVPLEGRRILIVEDVPDNAEICADLLEMEGADSEHAENGQIALDMFRQSDIGYYDAILMDLRMPIMDGLDAARGIRALDRADAKTVPIIAVTANAFESDVQNSLDAGMNAHLVKPIDVDLFYSTLRRWIKAARSQDGGTDR